MEPAAGPVLYQKLQLWEPNLEYEEEEEEEELAEPLVPDPWTSQDSSGNEVGGRPGAWAQLVAALLLLAVGFSLAVTQLQARGSSPGTSGSVAPPPSGHSHRLGVYHHSAIISPAATCSHQGRELLAAGGNVVDAGVGAALCLAVVHPHATGLGATFWGLFHNGSSGNSTALTPGPVQTLTPSLGLPSALPALRLLHTRFGHLPWSRLLVGPITLAQEGFVVDASLARALEAQGTEGLCPFLCHADGTPLGRGARAINQKLAAMLRRAARTPTPELAGDALLNLLAKDLKLERPLAEPMPTLEPALQLHVPQGVLYTTPSPSAGPELLTLLEAALHSGGPSPDSCLPQAPEPPGSSVLATVDSSGSVLLLTSSLNSSFGSRHLSPSTGVLLSNLVAKSATSAWAYPLILRDSLDDTEADVFGLVAAGSSAVASIMTHTFLSHLAAPQAEVQHQHEHQHLQGPTGNTSTCGQGTLLQVSAHAEHAHVSSIPKDCCSFQGF
ncbi:PREDICTED: gamma-glutamyltransferase 6 isoform X1 [Condylura cristata]|uniref:gamma-glutamyltransferase 6 isoform X1 n=1 Tax=Condylura cristata TaxID=143302 RepID=UPI00033471F6|nr:PREDICTED: gamma-glutamyltransferase 6 isoform X1 [Condylura cristata]